MNKVLHVAWREFVATVATKGFIIGVLVTPVLIAMLILVLPALIDEAPPKIDGELAVLDPTGTVAAGVREYLQPEAIAERRIELEELLDEVIPEPIKGLTDDPLTSMAMDQAMEAALGSVPELDVVELPAGADVEAEKSPLLEGEVQDGGRLALVVVADNAIQPDGEGEYGKYELFVREKLDDRLQEEIKDAFREVIVESRIEGQGLDPEEISALTRVGRVRSTTVTEEGERETNEILNMLLPAGFMVLLLVSVMTGGQYLLTTTIEEKSSRVVEVLLSAVSPMELMTGKIIGQLCVGLLLLVLYAGMGFSALVSFSLLGLIDPWLIVYLLIFYFIAYFVVASMMAAIGAAVNEMREAQTMMTPVMLVIMIPWILWLPISRDPNSLFATITSLVPPINSFVMLLRMTSTTPPPLWQVWLSIAIGVASVYAAVWFAAKVFRVGLLMHGKPPNLATLWRWVRAA
ncbi:MAG: ABC transporter permease [bacterium]|nr:ABC transporter permease [bacterium]